ncbi:hypothetical protein [Carnobacterium maltaromaticum]|uniref:hypothetical protein n=1 Tax=Carnobacterium maltaromaticum TaxID=2751 RepID=UPI0039BDD055
MKKWLLVSVFVVMIISFGGTFYIQHQAFSEQKSTMKSNFNKEQKKTIQQIKDLQTKNSELEKTIKTNEEKTNALQSELDNVKAEKGETVATNQEASETPVQQTENAPTTQQEAPAVSTPDTPTQKERTNAAGQTGPERNAELQSKVDAGEITIREKFDILSSEFP